MILGFLNLALHFGPPPRAIYLHQSNCFGSYGKRTSHWRSVDMFCMMRVNTAYSVVDLTTWYERETIRLWTHFVKLEGYQKLDYFIFVYCTLKINKRRCSCEKMRRIDVLRSENSPFEIGTFSNKFCLISDTEWDALMGLQTMVKLIFRQRYGTAPILFSEYLGVFYTSYRVIKTRKIVMVQLPGYL